MEKARRDHLRAVIGAARRDMEGSLRGALSELGLRTDTAPIPLDDLALDEGKRALYAKLELAISREGRAVAAKAPITPEAVARYVRESGATWINRLAALRALEARGMLTPRAAFVSDDYGGTSARARRLQDRDPSLDDGAALCGGIVEACAELSTAVRVLFDTDDDQSLVWPTLTVLRKVLRAFSEEVTDEDWRADDVLGWVYQYYNTEANAELKRRKNKTQGYKYTADDIPIANQFYTPHWVVRVLTDNTLGRLWLESQKRDPRMTSEAVTEGDATRTRWSLVERRAGVPHAAREAEKFRVWIGEEPEPLRDRTVDRFCRYLVPLPSTPDPRPVKRPAELRVIDPACGSGHFLLYAFDVLVAIWREGAPEVDPLEIPAKILEHNLHGLDIDLRAAQLAAFNLYLKARTTHAALAKELGRAGEPFRVRRVNLVVADAHLGDDPRKKTFLDRYKKEPTIHRLYTQVLESVDHTNVLGGLLKVRSQFEELFKPLVAAVPANDPRDTKRALAPRQVAFDFATRQQELHRVVPIVDSDAWTLERMLDDLRAFEREALTQQDIGARLFYSDLGRTLGLLGLLSQRYDVVLMNPPYGEMPEAAKDYCKGNPKKKPKIKAQYPRTHYDLYAVFLEQGIDLLHTNGMLGALVPWTYMFLSTLKELRSEIFCGEAVPELLQEYGYGILDGATVGTTGTVVRKRGVARDVAVKHVAVFERLSVAKRDAEKWARFAETLPAYAAAGPDAQQDWYVASLASLADVPGMPYGYWASDTLRGLFRKLPALDSEQKGALVEGRPDDRIGSVRQGLATGDDGRFLRMWWEVEGSRTGRDCAWVPFVKGGAAVSFYTDVPIVVLWEDDGEAMKASELARRASGLAGRGTSALGRWDWFYQPCVTWSRASWRLTRFGGVPAGCMFSDKGPAVLHPRVDELLGFLNSSLGSASMLMQTPERMWEVSMVGALPVASTLLHDNSVGQAARAMRDRTSRRFRGDETCRDFTLPDLLRLHRAASTNTSFSIEGLLARWLEDRQGVDNDIARHLHDLDEEVYRLYDISADDRALIERELARRPKAEGGYTNDAPDATEDDEATEDDATDDNAEADAAPATLTEERARDLVARWLSYYVKHCIEADDDGILPVATANREEALILRVRRAMVDDLSEAVAASLEQQCPPFLGVPSLAAWLEVAGEDTLEVNGRKVKAPRGFFPWHVAAYRNRPIFWLLSSEGFEKGKTRFTFRVYVHALKVNADTLTRVREYYLKPELDRVEQEWLAASKRLSVIDAAGRREAERAHQEWVNTRAALLEFTAAVDRAAKGPPTAEVVPKSAKWLARTIAAVRGGQDVGHGWAPEVDHGVRVNLTPLAEARLLPRVVLKKLGGK